MATDVIQEFLVELGWSIDKEGQKKFSEALSAARSTALGLAAALVAVGAAVVATADAYSRMGYEARNVSSSVSGMQSLMYAMRQMGGSAEGVRSSLQGISNFIRFGGPGAENVFKNLGIATRDARNHLRDTSDILEDFFKRARSMPQYQAAAYARLLGIDTNTLIAGEANPGMLHQQRDQYRDIYRRLGIDPDKAAAESQQMMQQVNRLMVAIQAIGEKVTLSLIHAFGGKDLDSFTNYLLSHSDDIAKAIKTIIDLGIQFGNTAIHAAQTINALVESTIGWKNALLGVFALFAASKVAPILLVLGQVLGLLTRISGLRTLMAATGGAAEAGGAVGAAVPVAVAAGVAGAGYVAYKGAGLIHRLWKNAHPDSPKDVQSRQDIAMNYFQSVGLTKEQAAGIVGNLTQESGVDPNRTGDHGAAHGIAQWHMDRARKIYEDFSIDVIHGSLQDQLKAIYLDATAGDDPQARKAWQMIRKARTVAESTHAFRQYYERPLDAHHNEDTVRGDYANAVYNRNTTTHSPSQVNHITVSVDSNKVSAAEITNAVTAGITKQWNSMLASSVPRRQGLLGAS